MAKGIPYGISDFSRLIDQNYYYVDKTHFIPQIEEIVSTPPRFRESTRCSILTFPKQTWDVEVWKTTSTIIAAYS